jgi:hypothetical protein
VSVLTQERLDWARFLVVEGARLWAPSIKLSLCACCKLDVILWVVMSVAVRWCASHWRGSEFAGDARMPNPTLTLRSEFRGAALKGTAIELATRSKTGATQISAADFLNITYPSYDLVKALQAIGPRQEGLEGSACRCGPW